MRILLVAHSQGGLSSVLWLNSQRPHHVEAVALDSPWLELQGNRMFRILSTPVVQAFQLGGGKTVMPMRDPGFYGRCIDCETGGDWDYLRHPLVDPQRFFPRAVDAGDLQCAGRGVAPARHPHSRAGVHVRPDHAAAHMG